MRLFLVSALLFALGCASPVLAADVREPEAAPEDMVPEPDSEFNVPDPDAASPNSPNAYMPQQQQPPFTQNPGAPSTPVTQNPMVQTPGAQNPTLPDGTPQAPVTSTPAIVNTPPAKPPGTGGDTNFDTVVLQGLNKVTARAESIEAPIGSVVRYGTIEIIAHKCWKSDPEDRPENAALLEVSEIKQGEKPVQIFSGWMFSSTPALSSLEHPFYDINVISCSKGEPKQ